VEPFLELIYTSFSQKIVFEYLNSLSKSKDTLSVQYKTKGFDRVFFCYFDINIINHVYKSKILFLAAFQNNP